MNPMNNDELRQLAIAGVKGEIERLNTVLLQLEGLSTDTPSPRRRRRHKMTPAQRREQSERMKKFWADRRRKSKQS